MTERISREDFQKLADLASLELPEEEAEYLRKELNNQLISIEVLESIPIDAEISSAAHGLPYTDSNSSQPRPDETRMDSHREEILAQAPELEEGYIVVPDIAQEELE
ncbi:MAG: Asp-tRNA(Asn)/Glu-tRNA(Gln) amidotransferase subunit GatC [Anaerolineales bacterium]